MSAKTERVAKPGAGVHWRKWVRRGFAAMTVLIGLLLLWPGVTLLTVGGSPYYTLAGLVTILAGILAYRGNGASILLYAVLLFFTTAWSVWESGWDAWALLPRVAGPAIWGLWLLIPLAFQGNTARHRLILGTAVVIALAAPLIAAFSAKAPYLTDIAMTMEAPQDTNLPADGEWSSVGRDAGATRFSPLTQVAPHNVDKLALAWTFRTGFRLEGMASAFEATPLKIGETVYLCTPDNDVFALDAETGKLLWRYKAKTDMSQVYFANCRGVAYYKAPGVAPGEDCGERIITATVDARLIGLDRMTGRPCSRFGDRGIVNLLDGMGPVEKGYYYVSSAPQVVRGKIVLGGWISDNQSTNEPSGVIRAFDAVSGGFAWAFDIGRPGDHRQPTAGQSYTRGTPNSWAPISADEQLGLVFLPTGNATPDWYGGHRRSIDDAISSSVIALDAATGALRWSFQTTHHDIWDYDVSSQPVLHDLPVGNGRIPVLIQPTKRGEIFVLDRRTGQPVTRVVERRVPQSDVPGERSAPTQPFSVGFPHVAGPSLTEKMMWGITPIDQAWCRVAFRSARYEGTMTPLGLKQYTVVNPGYMGGSDWGSVSVDLDRQILIANSNRMANYGKLITRAEADAAGVKAISKDSHGNPGGVGAMVGTPYAVVQGPFMSRLGVPCQQPPYGMLTAVDLKTRKALWERPLGSARDSGPLGIPSNLPILMGVPNAGGSMITRAGLVFIGAAQDRYLRAFDIRSGREIWKVRLPAGAQATPMSYWSSRSGRQFIIVAAGGHVPLGTKAGDYVMAFALPK